MKCGDKEWMHCRVEKMGCFGCHYSEQKADDILKELGYKKVENAAWGIEYKKEFKLKNPKHIIFGPDKAVAVCEENERGLAVRRDYFDTQELIAINKKCEELGWI